VSRPRHRAVARAASAATLPAVHRDFDLLQSFLSDAAHVPGGTAEGVVFPRDVDELAAVVSAARWVLPVGAQSSLTGGATPRGDVVVSRRGLSEIREVNGDTVRCGAGVPLSDLQRFLASRDLYYPPVPTFDGAFVGGTISTNAGGLNVVRYGRTDAQVDALDAVTGTGAVSHDADICGSEGTLAIVTGARLRLVPAIAEHTVALIGCSSVAVAIAAVEHLRAAGLDLEAAELFLADGLDLVCTAFSLPRPLAVAAPVYVLVEVASDDEATGAVAAAIADLPGVVDAVVASDAARRASLWRYREDHTLAINTLGPPHKLDVGLPSDALAVFLEEVPRRVAAVVPGARTWLFGHVAVGNVHVNITGVDPTDERIDDAVLTYVASLGGSISAEHGIGTAKRRWADLAWSSAELAALRARKRALDPDGILNPNVRLP